MKEDAGGSAIALQEQKRYRIIRVEPAGWTLLLTS